MLVDTNVLLRAAQPSHPMHEVAVRALTALMERERPLYLTAQNIAEFWNASTRPAANNGLGYTIEEARQELTKLEGFFEILTESPASYATWKALLVSHRVSGVQVHDARIVAVMLTNGLSAILTFDNQDFSRYPGVEVVHPSDLQTLTAPAAETKAVPE